MLNNKDTMAICNVNVYLLLILLVPTVEITNIYSFQFIAAINNFSEERPGICFETKTRPKSNFPQMAGAGGGSEEALNEANTPGGESYCILIWLGQIKEPGAPCGPAATQGVQSAAGKFHKGLNTKERVFQPEQQRHSRDVPCQWPLRRSYKMLTDTDERTNLHTKLWLSTGRTRSSQKKQRRLASHWHVCFLHQINWDTSQFLKSQSHPSSLWLMQCPDK